MGNKEINNKNVSNLYMTNHHEMTFLRSVNYSKRPSPRSLGMQRYRNRVNLRMHTKFLECLSVTI